MGGKGRNYRRNAPRAEVVASNCRRQAYRAAIFSSETSAMDAY